MIEVTLTAGKILVTVTAMGNSSSGGLAVLFVLVAIGRRYRPQTNTRKCGIMRKTFRLIISWTSIRHGRAVLVQIRMFNYFCKVACSLTLLFFLAGPSLAQDDECPKVAYNSESKLVRVSNINSRYKSDFSCQIATLSGVIKSLEYFEDGSTEPFAIVLELSNGSREQISFGDEPLEDCFSEADKSNWKAALVKGARVIVKAFACGAAGRGDLKAASIEFSANLKKPKQPKVKRRT